MVLHRPVELARVFGNWLPQIPTFLKSRLSKLGFGVKTTVAQPPMHYALELRRHLELNVRILKYPSQ
jgi:hypothetical protein